MSAKDNSKTLRKRALTRKRNAAQRRAIRRKRPLGRLCDDGACSTENICRRLQWLAHERQIPVDQLPKVLRTPTEELVNFTEKYHVSYDWLILGDLKGLHQMMGKPRASSTVERIMEKYEQLSPDLQRIVTEQVNRMLAEQAVEEWPEGA